MGYDFREELVKDVHFEEGVNYGKLSDGGEHEGGDQSPQLQSVDGERDEIREVVEEVTQEVGQKAENHIGEEENLEPHCQLGPASANVLVAVGPVA
jgi:hypothetical protein